MSEPAGHDADPLAAPTTPGQERLLDAARPRRIVVLAEDASDLGRIAPHLRGLVMAGHTVVLLWWHGTPATTLESIKARVQIAPEEQGRRSRVRALGRRVRRGRGGSSAGVSASLSSLQSSPSSPSSPLVRAIHQDPRALRTLESAEALIVRGAQAIAAKQELVTPSRPLVRGAELSRWEAVSGVWRRLREHAEGPASEITPRYLRGLVRQVRLLGGRVPASQQALLLPIVRTAQLSGRFDLAHDVASFLDPTLQGLDPLDRAERAGVQLLARTSAEGVAPQELPAVAGELVRAADTALERGDLPRLVELTTLALALLFHRELHADGLRSPLVEDPDALLADWRTSAVGRLLATGAPRQGPVESRALDGAPDRPRVVVVPGTYPQFCRPVVEALAERAEVRLVDLAARPRLKGLGVWRESVEGRLRQALGEDVVPDLEVREEMEAASAVFVDWADKGALATVMAVPPGVRLVLRVHSMDALSPWVHLLDWSRVDDLVVVSEPIRVLLERLLGARLDGTRVHVVPNVVDLSRIPTTKTGDHRRRLLMTGWGQQVKDPLWALEILGALRQEDPSWRLSLLGSDFSDDPARSQRRYARDFRARLIQDDVRDAVDIVGFTRDIAPHLASAGFVLSTSRRESFGLGLVEAAASGAVPVVRDWPIYAPLGAARSIFPDEWVIDTVEEAVARIRAAQDEPAWSAASAATRAVVAERFSTDRTRTTYQELVLGTR